MYMYVDEYSNGGIKKGSHLVYSMVVLQKAPIGVFCDTTMLH